MAKTLRTFQSKLGYSVICMGGGNGWLGWVTTPLDPGGKGLDPGGKGLDPGWQVDP